MRKNVFHFGDTTFWIQEEDTAMDTLPAPNCMTLYFGIHDLTIAPLFCSNLAAYYCYINDCLALWIHHPDPAIDLQNWNSFKESMNSYGKLTWEFTLLSQTVHFLDLTLVIPQQVPKQHSLK
jgi:hypothetical protein